MTFLFLELLCAFRVIFLSLFKCIVVVYVLQMKTNSTNLLLDVSEITYHWLY